MPQGMSCVYKWAPSLHCKEASSGKEQRARAWGQRVPSRRDAEKSSFPLFTRNFQGRQGRNYYPHFMGGANLDSEQFYGLPSISLLERVPAQSQSQFFLTPVSQVLCFPSWCLWVWLSLSSFTDPGWWTRICSGHLSPGWDSGARLTVGFPATFDAVQWTFPVHCLHCNYDLFQKQRTQSVYSLWSSSQRARSLSNP